MSTNWRWKHSVFLKGEDILSTWKEYFSKNPNAKVLFICVHGFDPRMNDIVKVLDQTDITNIDCKMLHLDEGDTDSAKKLMPYAKKNGDELRAILSEKGSIEEINIELRKNNGEANQKSMGAFNAFSKVLGKEDVEAYSDIIIDISSMPRSIYFSIIKKALKLIDEHSPLVNLFVSVSENAKIDYNIKGSILEERADYIYSFDGNINLEKNKEKPLIWIPMLGERRRLHNEKVNDFLNSLANRIDETIPVLPFPSKDPRRGDNILAEYEQLLFKNLDVLKQNIIYAAEQNPFDSYRQINKIIEDYDQSLSLLDGCRVTISPFCSKLISIGALLSYYEMHTMNGHSVGIVNIETHGYEVEDIKLIEDNNSIGDLFVLWLTGKPYERD